MSDAAAPEAPSDIEPATLRRFRRDPTTPALMLLAAVVFALHRFDGILTRDLGLYAYAGQRFADGVAPYEGVMNRSGPLAHMVPALGVWAADLFGSDQLHGERLTMYVLSVLLVGASYVVVRDLSRSRVAGALAATVLLTTPGIIFYATNGPREKTTMMLMLVALLWAVLRRRWVAAGVFLALATLTWQPVLFPGAATAAVAALLCTGQRVRALLGGLLGGGITTAVFVLYFVAAEALDVALDGFVRIHLHYTYQPGFSTDGFAILKQTEEALRGWLWLLVVGLAALLIFAVPAVRRVVARRGDLEATWLDRVVIATAVGDLIGLAWSWRTFNGWADALVLVPFALIGLSLLAVALGRLLVHVLPRLVVVGLAGLAFAVLLAGGVDYALADSGDVLAKQRAEVAAVQRVLPGATILSIEAPQPLVLAHAVNPSQHQMFRLGLEEYVDDTWPGGLAGYAAWIGEQRPDLVAVGLGAHYDWVGAALEQDYEPFGTSPGWYWYVRNDVSPETLAALEAAVRG